MTNGIGGGRHEPQTQKPEKSTKRPKETTKSEKK